MLFVLPSRSALAFALPPFAFVATVAVPTLAAEPAAAAPPVHTVTPSASFSAVAPTATTSFGPGAPTRATLASAPPAPAPGSADLATQQLTTGALATPQLSAPPSTSTSSSAGAPTGSTYMVPRVASDDASSASTVRPRWTDAFALDLSAATWVPLSVGPELAFELPGRIIAQVHLGWMPELYSHTMTDALEDAGAYDAEVGDLVDGVVQGATTWRIAAGWRPFESAGLELTVGYAHVTLDGRTRTSELIPFVPDDVADELNAEVGDVGIDLDSSIHHFTIAAGWRWLIADHLVIRANIGYLQAFGSSSRLDIEGRPDLTELAAPTVESVLHDHYMRYIKIPVVGLGVGYRFF